MTTRIRGIANPHFVNCGVETGAHTTRSLVVCLDNAHSSNSDILVRPGLPFCIPHLVSTSSSWLNMVEGKRSGGLDELTGKRIRHAVFFKVQELPKAIEEFLAAFNHDPKPFVRTATVDSMVEKLNRRKQTLERIKPGCTRPRMLKTKEKQLRSFVK